jgi:Dimethlysulfonioproprionate lyase
VETLPEILRLRRGFSTMISQTPASVQPALREFLAALEAAIARAGPTEAAAQVVRRVFDAESSADEPPIAAGEAPPVCVLLDRALATAMAGGSPAATVAERLAVLAPGLNWARRPGSHCAAPAFRDGHANACIIGPGGVASCERVMIGVSLMAPDLQYPDHRHPPAEVYYSLSPGSWRQGDGPWVTPSIGGLVYNPSNVVHSMRSSDLPLLAIWCLSYPFLPMSPAVIS